VDEIAALEKEASELAIAGGVSSPRGRTEIRAIVSGSRVHAVTEPPFFDESSVAAFGNIDAVLVRSSRIGDEEALVLAVAEGNYKDDATYLASAAAMCVIANELGEPLAAQVDVAPALRRALVACDLRIKHIAEQPIADRRIASSLGARGNLKGIGASVLVVVVAGGSMSIAHAGENRAVLVRGGHAHPLVVPHTLKHDEAYRDVLRDNPELAAHADDVVTNILGFGHERIDIVQVPIAKGERLILGNPALELLDDAWRLDQTDAADLVGRFLRETRKLRPHLPATIVVADL